MILRHALLAVALVWLAVGLWMVAIDGAAWPMLVSPVVLIAGIVFERHHYGGNASAASPARDWRVTDERFLDEATGRPVVVWFNPTTGERKYVDE